MKTIMRIRMSPHILIVVGLAIALVGSYQAAAATISCSRCTTTPQTSCNHGAWSPGGQPGCWDRSEGSCTSYSCRRCDGTFASAVKVCLQKNDDDDCCKLNGETEDCGDKHKRVCEWVSAALGCQCPASGGDEDGSCVFDECTGTEDCD